MVKMANSTAYILYCGQEANFQTRSMLIPYDLIIQDPKWVSNLQILRDHSLKNVNFPHRGKTYTVDQLLIKNYIWKGNFGLVEATPFREITGQLTSYACWSHHENCYFDGEDAIWADHIIKEVASEGFNNITNYCKYRIDPEYNIVEGFLVLEARDGVLEMPMVDTVKEMMDTYYPMKTE